MRRNDWLDRVLELSAELLALADSNGDDDEQLVLEGIVRDSAFKIIRAVQVAGGSVRPTERSAGVEEMHDSRES